MYKRQILKDLTTKTNFSGGIQGGISNGMDIYFNVAFKPVATIMKDQKTIDKAGKETNISGKTRLRLSILLTCYV